MRYENKNVRMGEILLLAVGRSDTGVPGDWAARPPDLATGRCRYRVTITDGIRWRIET
jgi:hypothetical protein